MHPIALVSSVAAVTTASAKRRGFPVTRRGPLPDSTKSAVEQTPSSRITNRCRLACVNDSPSSAAAFQALLDVVREEFGRVAYSHKTHHKMLDRLNREMLREKKFNAWLLVLTAGDTVGILVTDAAIAKVVAIVLSTLALLVTVYGLSRTREDVAEQHRVTTQALWLLREQYIHLIGDLKGGAISVTDGRARRDALTKSAAHIYASAPDTDEEAYQAARKALKTDEELTFSAREIDVMLPPALRSDVTSPPSAA